MGPNPILVQSAIIISLPRHVDSQNGPWKLYEWPIEVKHMSTQEACALYNTMDDEWPEFSILQYIVSNIESAGIHIFPQHFYFLKPSFQEVFILKTLGR